MQPRWGQVRWGQFRWASHSPAVGRTGRRMTVGLIINYSRLSDLEFASKSLGMVQALTGNVSFPSPYGASFPTLAEFTTAQSEYATAVGLAADRDKAKVADRNAK